MNFGESLVNTSGPILRLGLEPWVPESTTEGPVEGVGEKSGERGREWFMI